MISNQVLQNTLEGLKEISHLEFGIMDADGREVAVTAPVFADASGAIPDFALSPADSQSAGPFQFFKVFDEQQLEYVIVVYGDTDNTLLVGRMAAFQLKIAADTQRVVLIIEAGQDREKNALELIQEYVGTAASDFVTAVDENNVVIVRDLSDGSKKQKDINKMAAGSRPTCLEWA